MHVYGKVAMLFPFSNFTSVDSVVVEINGLIVGTKKRKYIMVTETGHYSFIRQINIFFIC